MSRRGWASLLRAISALGLLAVASAQANAGGFAVHEQSTYGQGTSFAGIAAGGALSSMFWNPATMTQFAGKGLEVGGSALFPYAANTPLPAPAPTLFGSPFGGGTFDTGNDALVANGYFTYQFTPNLWLGMSLNSPFGLSASFPDLWAGRDYGANSSKLVTYNAAPSLAYRFNDWISVGIGAQIQYAKATLNKGATVGPPPFADTTLHGDGWAYGLTAGVTLTPTPTTTIGIGYRSALNQDIDGSLLTTGLIAPFSNGSIHTTVNLPDIVSLGVRQRVTPQFTLLGTAEWTNWSRIGTSNVLTASGAPALVGPAAVTIPFQYKDGWFFALGGEYQWSDRLTLRAGAAYEISPIDDRVRIPLIPDNNRVWASIGASWQVFRGFSFDLAYSHIWVQDPSINITSVSGNPSFDGANYIGTVNAHVDVLSLAMVFRWGAPEPVPVVKPIISK
ncbi:MAG: outer membrane protein transport protein [Pseudolabrys sp.]